MTVSQAHVSKTQPGRIEEAISLAREGAKLVGRHGGQVRYLTPVFGGEATGTSIFDIEYTDEAAFGRAMEEMSTDPELQEFMVRMQRPDSATVMISDSLSVDVPTGYASSKPRHGSIVEVHMSRPIPGRTEELIASCAKVCRFVEKHGGTNARTFQVVFGGASSGLWGVSWELTDWNKLAKLATAWQTDKVGLQIQAESMSSETPSTYVTSAIYQDVPL